MKAALGVKIVAPELEKAIAGSRLLVVGPDDDEDATTDVDPDADADADELRVETSAPEDDV